MCVDRLSESFKGLAGCTDDSGWVRQKTPRSEKVDELPCKYL